MSNTKKSKRGALSVEKTKVKSKIISNSSEQAHSQAHSRADHSPVAYYDEDNRKVVIISNDP
jgi:hypothetical protein